MKGSLVCNADLCYSFWLLGGVGSCMYIKVLLLSIGLCSGVSLASEVSPLPNIMSLSDFLDSVSLDMREKEQVAIALRLYLERLEIFFQAYGINFACISLNWLSVIAADIALYEDRLSIPWISSFIKVPEGYRLPDAPYFVYQKREKPEFFSLSPCTVDHLSVCGNCKKYDVRFGGIINAFKKNIFGIIVQEIKKISDSALRIFNQPLGVFIGDQKVKLEAFIESHAGACCHAIIAYVQSVPEYHSWIDGTRLWEACERGKQSEIFFKIYPCKKNE